jgi:hypothetical protein
MKNKIMITIILGMFLISLASISAAETLGNFEFGKCMNLSQTCATCSYVNISSVSHKDNGILLTNVEMNAFGNGEWRYEFCNTTNMGRHEVRGQGDIDGADETFTYFFDVTPTGDGGNVFGLYILLYVVLFGIVIFGFAIRSEWIAILGGLGLIFLGIWTLNSGIVIFRNVATEVTSWITIGFGAIVSIVTGLEIINNEL